MPSQAAPRQVAKSNLTDHTARWYGDEGFETGNGDDALARYVAERMPQLPQLFPLGEFFSYNNSGFQLLGRLIEVATYTAYYAAMRSPLLAPLGLDDTLLDHVEVLQQPYAAGHAFQPINGQNALAVQTPLWVPRSVDPADGIWPTTRDVIPYARFHLDTAMSGGKASVVQPATLRRMQEPAVNAPGLPLSMGRDWFIQAVGDGQIIAPIGTATDPLARLDPVGIEAITVARLGDIVGSKHQLRPKETVAGHAARHIGNCARIARVARELEVLAGRRGIGAGARIDVVWILADRARVDLSDKLTDRAG